MLLFMGQQGGYKHVMFVLFDFAFTYVVYIFLFYINILFFNTQKHKQTY